MKDKELNDIKSKKLKDKENISLLIFVGCFFSVLGINYILSIVLANQPHKDLITYLFDLAIVLAFATGYLFYSWKSDLAEFFRRLTIATPLATFSTVFAVILFDNISFSFGLINGLLFLLLLKTQNRKQHFTVIMILALTALIVMKFLQSLPIDESKDESYLKMILSFSLYMPLAIFFSFYTGKILKGREFKTRSVIFKTLKFFIIISIFLSLFMMVSFFGKEWQISIRLLISTLISIMFIIVCYKFDLLPEDVNKKQD